MVDRRVLPSYGFQHKGTRDFNIKNAVTTLWLNSSGVCTQLLRLGWPGGKGTAPPNQHHLCAYRGNITAQERPWMRQSREHLLSGNSTQSRAWPPRADPRHCPCTALRGSAPSLSVLAAPEGMQSGNVQFSADSPHVRDALSGTGAAW